MALLKQSDYRVLDLRVSTPHVIEPLPVQSPHENCRDELLVSLVQRIHLEDCTLTGVHDFIQRDVLFGMEQVVPLD
jgi:hypothetical protein